MLIDADLRRPSGQDARVERSGLTPCDRQAAPADDIRRLTTRTSG